MLLRLGRGAEALADWKQELAARPPAHDDWFGYAELCLFLGDEAEYRRARRDLLAQFGATTDPDVAERTGRACLLLPPAADELRQAVALVERAVAVGRPGHEFDYPYYLFAEGLARYRQGRFDDAIKIMTGDAATSSWGRAPASSWPWRGTKRAAGTTPAEALEEAIRLHDWTAKGGPPRRVDRPHPPPRGRGAPGVGPGGTWPLAPTRSGRSATKLISGLGIKKPALVYTVASHGPATRQPSVGVHGAGRVDRRPAGHAAGVPPAVRRDGPVHQPTEVDRRPPRPARRSDVPAGRPVRPQGPVEGEWDRSLGPIHADLSLVARVERLVLVRWKIRLMLNLTEADHRELDRLIGAAVERLWAEPPGEADTDADIESISRQAKGILKREWERVKRGT